MKNALLKTLPALFAAFIFSYGFSQQPNQAPGKLRIMTYNIHHANPPFQDDAIDLDAIIEVIQSRNPELVALQEIDVDTKRSGPGNQAEIIAEALGMHVFFGKSIDFEGGAYGLAILSKFPLKNARIYRLPTIKSTNGEPRILAIAEILLPGDNPINFACTHLDAQQAEDNRILQIKEIQKIFSDIDIPSIIAGDFNAAPGSKVIDNLDETFRRTCQSCPPSIPVKTPEKAIDFIAFKDKTSFKIKSHEVLKNSFASDHLPVFAILQY